VVPFGEELVTATFCEHECVWAESEALKLFIIGSNSEVSFLAHNCLKVA
jgi:hypothetical protein